MQVRALPAIHHYIRLKISPPTQNELTVRKTIANALAQAFGSSAEATYLDILSLAEDGAECVLRTNPNDGPHILTSLIAWSETPQFTLIKESPFLPSLLNVQHL